MATAKPRTRQHPASPRIVLAQASPAFRRWFRGSVVTDGVGPGRGRPMVVYHGTRSPVDFDDFGVGDQFDEHGEMAISGSRDPSAHMGPHFTESAEVAGRFACGRAAEWDRRRMVAERDSCGGRVIPVYLAIRNPLVFDSDESMQAWIHSACMVSSVDEWVGAQIEYGGWSESDDGIVRDERGADLSGLDIFEKFQDDNFDNLEPEVVDQIVSEYGDAARMRAIELGHDGVRYWNTIEGGGWSWIAFNTSQVKSAIGNDGSYDHEALSLVRNPPRAQRHGIVLQRVGGLSPVRQDHAHAPVRRGVWASIWPHFDPFLIGGKASNRRAEFARDGARTFVHTGALWTLLPVPGASRVVDTPNRTWYHVDADALRAWLPTWRALEAERDERRGVKSAARRLLPSTMNRMFFEVFVERPTGGTATIGKMERQLREGRRASRRGS